MNLGAVNTKMYPILFTEPSLNVVWYFDPTSAHFDWSSIHQGIKVFLITKRPTNVQVMKHCLFTLMLYVAMGVETRVPDEAALGAEYPNYGELSPEWKGQDRVFVHKELFDEMATGLLCPIL